MSPLLFVLAMEYLTRVLTTIKDHPDLNYHPRCKKLNIIQLSFADDLLLFCRGDTMSIHILYDCFQDFSKVSGLILNQSKRCVYFAGVPVDIQQEILQKLGFRVDELSFRYHGVPLSSK